MTSSKPSQWSGNRSKTAAAAGAAMMLAACSSGTGGSTSSPTASPPSPPEPTVTVTATPTTPATTATPTTAPVPAKSGLPTPPPGSRELSKHKITDGTYARYANSSLGPAKVVNRYKKKATKAGYSIKSAGGSGGGWGGYGGSEAGMTAAKSGAYLAVQAGGSRSGPTYFEVCVGADKGAVDECDHRSGRDSRSSGS